MASSVLPSIPTFDERQHLTSAFLQQCSLSSPSLDPLTWSSTSDRHIEYNLLRSNISSTTSPSSSSSSWMCLRRTILPCSLAGETTPMSVLGFIINEIKLMAQRETEERLGQDGGDGPQHVKHLQRYDLTPNSSLVQLFVELIDGCNRNLRTHRCGDECCDSYDGDTSLTDREILRSIFTTAFDRQPARSCLNGLAEIVSTIIRPIPPSPSPSSPSPSSVSPFSNSSPIPPSERMRLINGCMIPFRCTLTHGGVARLIHAILPEREYRWAILQAMFKAIGYNRIELMLEWLLLQNDLDIFSSTIAPPPSPVVPPNPSIVSSRDTRLADVARCRSSLKLPKKMTPCFQMAFEVLEKLEQYYMEKGGGGVGGGVEEQAYLAGSSSSTSSSSTSLDESDLALLRAWLRTQLSTLPDRLLSHRLCDLIRSPITNLKGTSLQHRQQLREGECQSAINVLIETIQTRSKEIDLCAEDGHGSTLLAVILALPTVYLIQLEPYESWFFDAIEGIVSNLASMMGIGSYNGSSIFLSFLRQHRSKVRNDFIARIFSILLKRLLRDIPQGNDLESIHQRCQTCNGPRPGAGEHERWFFVLASSYDPYVPSRFTIDTCLIFHMILYDHGISFGYDYSHRLIDMFHEVFKSIDGIDFYFQSSTFGQHLTDMLTPQRGYHEQLSCSVFEIVKEIPFTNESKENLLTCLARHVQHWRETKERFIIQQLNEWLITDLSHMVMSYLLPNECFDGTIERILLSSK